MAVIAEGIDKNPEWVQMIKDHKNWEVQCHGLEHKVMKHMSYQDLYLELKHAKEKIQDTFHQKVVEFYPPKHYYSEAMLKACSELGMSLMVERNITGHWFEDKTITSVYYHFWSPRQIEEAERILNYK